jgi:hypothetical protein
MKFLRKVLLALFGTPAFTALVICVVLYGTLSACRLDEFETSYVDHMNLLGKAMSRIEESQARIAVDAPRIVKFRDF